MRTKHEEHGNDLATQKRDTQFDAERFRFTAKKFGFTFLKLFGVVRILWSSCSNKPVGFISEVNTTMTKLLPVFFALLPLAAIISACVVAP